MGEARKWGIEQENHPHHGGVLRQTTRLSLNDWLDRWLEGSTTPWYPSARLFRQQRAGEWSPIFEEVAAALEQLVRERGRLTA